MPSQRGEAPLYRARKESNRVLIGSHRAFDYFLLQKKKKRKKKRGSKESADTKDKRQNYSVDATIQKTL